MAFSHFQSSPSLWRNSFGSIIVHISSSSVFPLFLCWKHFSIGDLSTFNCSLCTHWAQIWSSNLSFPSPLKQQPAVRCRGLVLPPYSFFKYHYYYYCFFMCKNIRKLIGSQWVFVPQVNFCCVIIYLTKGQIKQEEEKKNHITWQ